MTSPDVVGDSAATVRGARNWTAVLAAHAFAAGGWWWMMPHGFPPSHPRFWVNEVLPLVVILLAVIGIIGFVVKRLTLAGAICLAITCFWLALLLATAILFPVSRLRLLPIIAVVAAALAADYWFRAPGVRLPRRLALPVALVAIVAGAGVSLAERAPEASTTPRGAVVPSVDPHSSAAPASRLVGITPELRVDSQTGTVLAQCRHLSLDIEPLLSFESCSPDGCWTIFAPPERRTLSRRTPAGGQVSPKRGLFAFEGDGHHALRVQAIGAGTTLAIESFTTLDAPIYSHLNSCCQFVVTGHRRLALAFSPCPEVRVDVEPADYPVGRPACFAFLDAGSEFRVVEATSGEKGPFRTLGSGHFEVDEPLELSLYDDDELVGTIALTAWAQQASTELSPTAGWGVPMNAIEFRRLGEGASAPVALWMTLAGTSVGRGWDSVGHRAGTYYNLLVISPARTRAR